MGFLSRRIIAYGNCVKMPPRHRIFRLNVFIQNGIKIRKLETEFIENVFFCLFVFFCHFFIVFFFFFSFFFFFFVAIF